MLVKKTAIITLSLLAIGLSTAGTVSYYDDAMPTTLNPLFARSMVDTRVHELVFDRLFYRSVITNSLTSDIVRSFDVQDDGATMAVTVVDGIKWHDGHAFTAADVCFTINTLLDTNIPTTIGTQIRKDVKSCTADGETASIRFKRLFFSPRERLSIPIVPQKNITSSGLSPSSDFSSMPVGTGPMSAVKKRRNVEFTRYKNPHHHSSSSSIQSLMLNDSLDSAVRIGTLLNGGVHGITSIPPASRQRIQALDDVALWSYDLRSWWFIALNTNKGSLADPKIRAAVDHAIDKEALRKLTVGFDPSDIEPACTFISGPFINASPYYNNQVASRNTADTAVVTQLMTEAGASSEYGRWILDGEPVTFKIGIHAPLEAEAADLLAQVGNQLQAGGFDRQVYKITNDDWARLTLAGQMNDFDMLIGKWSFGLVEDVSPIFHTRGNKKGRFNIFNYSNPRVDELLAAHETATTDNGARRAYHDLHTELSEDRPYLFLWRLDTKSSWRQEINSVSISPYFYFTEFEDWRFSD